MKCGIFIENKMVVFCELRRLRDRRIKLIFPSGERGIFSSDVKTERWVWGNEVQFFFVCAGEEEARAEFF